MAETITTLFLLAGAVWFWNDSLRARERRRNRGRDAYSKLRVKLLDETVALARTTFERDARGRLLLHRWYRFEFSTDGMDRHPARASLAGQVIELVRLEDPQGPTIISSNRLYRVASGTA